MNQITEADIRTLIDAARSEGVQLDYKRELPSNADEGKKEFLGDVSSFANKIGGDLVFGVGETREDGRATGIAGEIVPIPTADADGAVLRLEAIAREGLNPRLPDLQIARVPVAGGEVLVMRIGQSFIAPHQVAFQRNGKFYSRNSSGKYQMDVDEIGRAFRWRDALPAKVLQFHRERLTMVLEGLTSVGHFTGLAMVLHVIPLSSFTGNTIDVPSFLGHKNRLRPLRAEHYLHHRFNIDGLLLYGPGPTDGRDYLSYSQLFRNAVIETAARYGGGEGTIPIVTVERDLIRAVDDYRATLRGMNIAAPYVIHVSVAGTNGLCVPRGANSFANRDLLPIDRDRLELPGIIDGDPDTSASRVLRPALDALWQAGGHERCLHYNTAGDYQPGR